MPARKFRIPGLIADNALALDPSAPPLPQSQVVGLYLQRPNTIALLGHSVPANATLDASGNPWNGSNLGQSLPGNWRYYPSSSWFSPFQSLTRHRLKLSANFGIGGQTSDQIAARVNSVLALNPLPGYCLIDNAINDIKAGVSAAAIQVNTLATIAPLIAKGIVPILPNLSPCGQVVPGTSAFTQLNLYNSWLRDYLRINPNVLGPDVSSVMADPVSGLPAGGNPSGGGGTVISTTVDYLHDSQFGGGLKAYSAYQLLDPIISRANIAATNPRDPANLLNTVSTSIPLTAGTTGTLAGTATGQLATGWVVNSATGTATLSKVVRPNTNYEWQKAVLSGGNVSIRTGTVVTGFNVGDKVSLSLDWDSAGDWGTMVAPTVSRLNIQLVFNAGSVAYTADNFLFNGADPSNLFPFPASRDGQGYVLKTPLFGIPSGTTGLQAVINFVGTGTLLFSRAELRVEAP